MHALLLIPSTMHDPVGENDACWPSVLAVGSSDVNFDVPRDFVPDLVVLRAIDSVGDPATKEGTNDARL